MEQLTIDTNNMQKEYNIRITKEESSEEGEIEYVRRTLLPRNMYYLVPENGKVLIKSPMDRYNIYGNPIRCMKCDSLYHVQKDCDKK